MQFDEEEFKEIIEPHIKKCRPGDWEHAQLAVHWVKELGQDRADLDLLIIAAYVHDLGWRGIVADKLLSLEELLSLEPQANRNSEPFITELLANRGFTKEEIATVIRLVRAADKHQAGQEDEAIIVDADSLGKLDFTHIRNKFRRESWPKSIDILTKQLPHWITTAKGKRLWPGLLKKLKNRIL